jgi:hypothetical protein
MFNRKKAEEVFDNAEQPKHKSGDYYRVGVTSDGFTTLTLIDTGMSMTLTLNEHGLRQMIRLLEATIPETADE